MGCGSSATTYWWLWRTTLTLMPLLFGFAVTQVMVIFQALELNATNVFCLIFQNKFIHGSKWFSAEISVTCAFMLRNYEVALTSCDYLRLNGAWNNAYLFTTTSSIYVFITNSHQMQTATCSCVITALTDAVSGDADNPQFLCLYFVLLFSWDTMSCNRRRSVQSNVNDRALSPQNYFLAPMSWFLVSVHYFSHFIFHATT